MYSFTLGYEKWVNQYWQVLEIKKNESNDSSNNIQKNFQTVIF